MKRITAIVKEKANAKHLTFFLGPVKEKGACLNALVFKPYDPNAEEARLVLKT